MTLFHRRADLSETMSDYLIHDLERAGVLVRGRSEIAALHGAHGQLEAATLRDGERIPLSFLFLFLGAAPNTDWLAGTIALDDDGFVLAGRKAGAEGILETSVPGVFAVGDVRSGSVKRCATAVGEGAMVVRFVPRALLPPTSSRPRRPAADLVRVDWDRHRTTTLENAAQLRRLEPCLVSSEIQQRSTCETSAIGIVSAKDLGMAG